MTIKNTSKNFSHKQLTVVQLNSKSKEQKKYKQD